MRMALLAGLAFVFLAVFGLGHRARAHEFVVTILPPIFAILAILEWRSWRRRDRGRVDRARQRDRRRQRAPHADVASVFEDPPSAPAAPPQRSRRRMRVLLAPPDALTFLLALGLILLTIGIAAGFGGSTWGDEAVMVGFLLFLGTGIFAERRGWAHDRSNRRARRGTVAPRRAVPRSGPHPSSPRE